MQLTRAISTSGQSLPTATNAYIANLLEEISYYQEVLERDISPELRQSIEDKLAYAEGQATRQASMTHSTKDPNKTIGPIPITDGPFPTGIFEGQGQEYKPSVAKINNRWQGVVGSEIITIWAGALAEDPEQGVLYIQRHSMSRKFISGGRYLTLEKAGSIRIVDVQENRLILNTEDGHIFYFDVPGERFVASLEEQVPTITPIPTGTPYIPYNPYP